MCKLIKKTNKNIKPLLVLDIESEKQKMFENTNVTCIFEVTTQHNTAQHNTTQHNTTQHKARFEKSFKNKIMTLEFSAM
jgi:hypothetical protein